MSQKEKRSGILNALSNWIKLLGLVVLVAEVIILLAMTQTPVDSKLYVVYPIMMFVLLLVVIIAIIYDRSGERKSNQLSISANNQALTIDLASMNSATLQEGVNKYTNSLLKYEFELPSGNGWNEPQSLSYKEYIEDIMLIDIEDEAVFNTNVRNKSILGPSFVNSNVLKITHGEMVTIQLDQETTTPDVEIFLDKLQQKAIAAEDPMSPEEVVAMRQQLNQTETIKQIAFNSKIEVMTFKKEDYDYGDTQLNLPKFFQTFIAIGAEPIETLIAKDDYILWTTSTKLKHVIIKEKRQETFSISRWYQLHNGNKHVYLTSMHWSPEFDPTMNVWERLKASFESFKIKK